METDPRDSLTNYKHRGSIRGAMIKSARILEEGLVEVELLPESGSPVTMKTRHISGIQPGMVLAFVEDELGTVTSIVLTPKRFAERFEVC